MLLLHHQMDSPELVIERTVRCRSDQVLKCCLFFCLSHFTLNTVSLCQCDLILLSAHKNTRTWVCNFRDQTQYNSACNVTYFQMKNSLSL